MRRDATATARKGRPVELHARRVALGATLLALVVYVVACAIADLVVANRLDSAMNARLTTRLHTLTRTVPRSHGTVKMVSNPPHVGSGDLDDAPILAWFVPTGATSAQRLVAGAPTLPVADLHVRHVVDASVAGRNLRLDGAAVHNGQIVVATSTQEVTNVEHTLMLIEGVLAPVLLLALFFAASIIGRRAAAPIEQARRRQLEFTADASHELRTPLSVIEAEVGLALSTARTADSYRSAIERISGESKRLRDIVEDLLWLARLDALPLDPPSDTVDLVSIVSACAARFEALAARKSVTLSVASDGRFGALVVAPADWLDRLVSVLVDNACRYVDTGGRIDLVVSTSEERVTLYVNDDGPGIAEHERDRIRQRFHRASAVPGGAGLGLSIADVVVRATGGEWSIGASALGGASVRVAWRRARFDEDHVPPPTPDAVEATPHLVAP